MNKKKLPLSGVVVKKTDAVVLLYGCISALVLSKNPDSCRDSYKPLLYFGR